ncbi:MAG: orotate phosphoribosyltransferase-like protein [Thermoplasmata archaeon]|nr:orotate phosphoribosyltransferase-like protein [Thermoplasmata archaeon]
MVDVRDLAAKASALNKKGLSTREIAQELHLAAETISYLLEYGPDGIPPTDIKIGWRSIGVSGTRISLLSELIADIVLEEMDKKGQEIQAIVGVSLNGVPFATVLSEILGVDLAIYRPLGDVGAGGAFSSNFANVNGKKVVIIDDVISTGQTLRGAINDIKDAGGEPVLAVCIVNKSSANDLEGVPLRGLIRARSLGGTLLGGGLTKGGFQY